MNHFDLMNPPNADADKMFHAMRFNGVLYSAYLYTLERDFVQPYEFDVDSIEPHPLVGEMNDEWLEREVACSFKRDDEDPFYKRDYYEESLYDVVSMPATDYLIVLNKDNQFFGKIRLYHNDSSYTTNAMYLYVSGDKRRASNRSTRDRISSAGIVWYFVAKHSQQVYGSVARVLIPNPRKMVYKACIEYDATFVMTESEHADVDDSLGDHASIRATIRLDNTREFHSEVKQFILRVIPIPTYFNSYTKAWSALFNAHDIVHRIEFMDRS